MNLLDVRDSVPPASETIVVEVKSQRVVYETPDCGGHRINLS